MNILGIFLINQIRTGGDRDYLELLEALASRGNNVFVIINSCLKYRPRYFTGIELSVIYRRRGFPPASFLFKREIRKNAGYIKNFFSSLNKENFFIHIHGDIYLKSALLLKRSLNIPLFYGSRNNDIDRDRIFRKMGVLSFKEYLFSLLYEQINRHREKQIKKHAELITFLNTSERDAFIERTKCGINKISIIPNSTAMPHFDRRYRASNSSTGVKTILYVGGLSFNKGFWNLLKAVAVLKKRGLDHLEYYALGRTENIEKTLELIQKLEIGGMIHLEGYKDPFPYYEKCDLFVYPALYEAFGNVITESLYTGCPVIASAVGGIPDILEYPELLFSCGDTEELCNKIERCVLDSRYYRNIRFLCSERIKHFDFNWEGRFEEKMKSYWQITGKI
jgi:glycosyltransferase involved in cell wall biosynthesis